MLPWAGVRFILQVVVNDEQNWGTMAEGLELVSNLITRCRTWEKLFMMKESGQLTQALLLLYKADLGKAEI